jgi:hypothetical protein
MHAQILITGAGLNINLVGTSTIGAVVGSPASNTENDDEMSSGVIAGIVIGVIVFVCLVGAGFYFFGQSKSKPFAFESLLNGRDVTRA